MSGEGAPERALVLAYAPADRRSALAALLALDDALALLLRTTREPALGQLRLAWWREALARLDTEPAPAEPVLQGIADTLLPLGITGASLVPIVHGWEVLVEEDALGADALARFGAGRGTLFDVAARTLGASTDDPAVAAGKGWALVDLARHLRAPEEAVEAGRQAADALEPALRQRWSRRGRALGALAHLARMDLAVPAEAPVPHGAPRRVARLFWHRLTGR
jgi:15-cis-phytoene synthase